MHFPVIVSNTGNRAVVDLRLTSPDGLTSLPSCSVSALEPANATRCEGTFTLSQAQFAAGFAKLQMQAKAKSLTGTDVSSGVYEVGYDLQYARELKFGMSLAFNSTPDSKPFPGKYGMLTALVPSAAARHATQWLSLCNGQVYPVT
jgi:hypothetical protein